MMKTQKAIALAVLMSVSAIATAHADVGVTLRFGQNDDGELAWDEDRPGRGLYG